jgi:hypothetical protein
MVRIVERRVRLSVDCDAAFALLFGTPAFDEKFHGARGDLDVVVLDWISGANQRLLTFAMVERDAAGTVKDRTKCIEKQTSLTAANGSWRVVSVLKPDATVSNLFTVETVYACAGAELVITATIACEKKIWGVSGFVESIVEKQTAASLDLYCQLATETLSSAVSASAADAASTNGADVCIDVESGGQPRSSSSSSSSSVLASARGSNRHKRPSSRSVQSALPHRQLSTMKRVAHGHDSIVQLLSFPSPSAEYVRQATDFEHDVKENRGGGVSGRRRTCRCCVLLTLLAVAVAAVLAVTALGSAGKWHAWTRETVRQINNAG